jgi:hypothetical protein
MRIYFTFENKTNGEERTEIMDMLPQSYHYMVEEMMRVNEYMTHEDDTVLIGSDMRGFSVDTKTWKIKTIRYNLVGV